MPSDLEPMLLSVAQTAKVLSLGRDAVYELIARNELPHIRLGERTVRVPRQLLVEWIAEQAKAPSRP